MDRFIYRDIVTCIHNQEYHNTLSLVMKEYKDKIALGCFHRIAHNRWNYYDLPISTIELKDIKYRGESDPYIMEPIEVSILWRYSEEDSSDKFIADYPGGNRDYIRINRRDETHVNEMYNFNDDRLGPLPDNYYYTYEKEGWLKEVVDSA